MQSAARTLMLSAALTLLTVPAPASSVPAETSSTQRTLTVNGVATAHGPADTTRIDFMLVSMPKPRSIPQQLSNTLQQMTSGQEPAPQAVPLTRETLRPLIEVLESDSASAVALESPARFPGMASSMGGNMAKLSVDVRVGRERVERLISAVSEAARTSDFLVSQSLLYYRRNDCLPLEKRARAEALTKARARALELASATGVRLGRVLGIKETDEVVSGLCGSAAFPQDPDGVYRSNGEDIEWRTVLEVTYELK